MGLRGLLQGELYLYSAQLSVPAYCGLLQIASPAVAVLISSKKGQVTWALWRGVALWNAVPTLRREEVGLLKILAQVWIRFVQSLSRFPAFSSRFGYIYSSHSDSFRCLQACLATLNQPVRWFPEFSRRLFGKMQITEKCEVLIITAVVHKF